MLRYLPTHSGGTINSFGLCFLRIDPLSVSNKNPRQLVGVGMCDGLNFGMSVAYIRDHQR